MQTFALRKRPRLTGKVEEIDIGMTDLIIEKQSEVLNGDEECDFMNIIRANPSDYVYLSDTDGQLVFKIMFRNKVDIRKISFRATVKREDAVRPTLVHLYTKRTSFDFEDADNFDPVQTIKLNEKLLHGEKIDLIGTDFRNTESIQIFIEENESEDHEELTFLNRIGLFGSMAQAYANSYNDFGT